MRRPVGFSGPAASREAAEFGVLLTERGIEFVLCIVRKFGISKKRATAVGVTANEVAQLD